MKQSVVESEAVASSCVASGSNRVNRTDSIPDEIESDADFIRRMKSISDHTNPELLRLSTNSLAKQKTKDLHQLTVDILRILLGRTMVTLSGFTIHPYCRKE
jgi:hypothetical protein